MSVCINDDLIWVSIPRCASTSIENALLKSGLPLKHYAYGTHQKYPKHTHIKLSYLYEKFGIKETVCIKRDFFDRFISGLRHVWKMYDELDIPLKIEWDDVDNEYIYKTFTQEYVNEIYSMGKGYPQIRLHEGDSIVNENLVDIKKLPKGFFPENILRSQLYETDGKTCTYEFDIKEIDKFESFIEQRYNINFKLEKINNSDYGNHKIVFDDELRNWVWEKFEKPFIRTNTII